MAIDPDVQASLPQFFGTEDPPAIDVVTASRERLERLAEHGPAATGAVSVDDQVVAAENNEVAVRVYTPVAPGGPGLVFFHGGGWVSGSIHTHDVICRAFASRLSAVVVAVEYRLAPEHLHPAAVEDAWLATRSIAADPGRFGISGAGLVVGGDSAGGALAAAVARRARDSGWELAGQVLMYPIADYPADRPSYRRYGQGFGLTAAAMEFFVRTYTGDAERNDSDVAPLRCEDLSGIAPAVIVTAECDVLCDEGEEYAQRLRAAGVSVYAARCPGVVHGFLRIAGEVPAAAAGFDLVLELMSEAFGYPGGNE